MNDTHVDRDHWVDRGHWLESLRDVLSRRGLVRGLAAGLGLAAIGGSDTAEAGKRRTRKRRRRKKRRQRRRQDQTAPPPPPPPPFCAGIDVCQADETPCQASGAECRCFVQEATGEPFCGENTSLSPFPFCEACAAEDTCVTCMGGVLCARPCPNPL